MNIFATHDCPVQSALVLDDLRLNKMIVESAQMLSTVMFKNKIDGNWYKPAYVKHPCTIWAGISRENFQWLATHGLAMCMIFEMTNDKIHATEPVLRRLKEYSSRLLKSSLTEFEDCTTYKNLTVPVTEKYRLYLNDKWNNDSNPTWKKRNVPSFFIPKDNT